MADLSEAEKKKTSLFFPGERKVKQKKAIFLVFFLRKQDKEKTVLIITDFFKDKFIS